MAKKTPTMEKAWAQCDFCKQSDMTILALLKDKDKWDKLPLHFGCAYTRMCQVGFPRLGRDKIWKEFTKHRADTLNSPSYSWDFPSDWDEGDCEIYTKAQKRSGEK